MILDVALGIVALIVLFAGILRGFLKVFNKWASFFAVIFGLIFLTGTVASLIGKTGLEKYFVGLFEGSFSGEKFSAAVEKGNVDGFRTALHDCGVPAFFASILSTLLKGLLPAESVSLGTFLSQTITTIILNVIAAILLIIVIMLLLFIIKKVLLKLQVFTPVKVLDRIFGVIISFVIYAFFVILIFGIIAYLNKIIDIGFLQKIEDYILDSKVGGFIYENLFISK